MRLAFIGNGGIGRSVQDALRTNPSDFEVVAVLTRSCARPTRPMVDGFDAMMSARPDVVVECAGHQALKLHAEAVLLRGTVLVAVSTGALADEAFHARLLAAAETAGGRLVLPSGAIGGLDALAAAKLGGLHEVIYRGRKPPAAWKNSPAAELVDLDALSRPVTIFSGDARQAALSYPSNANVAASVALAGVGFDRTRVELIADPTVSRNIHELRITGHDGTFAFTLEGAPSPSNPKTSLLTAHSVARTLFDLRAQQLS